VLLVSKIAPDKIDKGFTITNLGKQDMPVKNGEIELEAIYGPFICSDTFEKYIGVITVGGRMFMTISFEESIIDKRTVEQLKEAVKRILSKETG